MGDGDSNKDMEEDIFGKPICKVSHDSNVFQPFWVRCDTVLSLYFDREFVVRKFNFVLRIGIIFWIIFLFSKII